MRALVVYCHPNPDSFSAHIRDVIVTTLVESGHEAQVIDLYDEAFDPVMGLDERLGYHTPVENEIPVAEHLARIRWCEGVIFIYPTWWFGLPAMLKGWLDRVLIPHATFTMPTESRPMQRQLTNIRTVAVFTTCGAPWWQSKLIGEPGRRTLLRGFRAICNPICRTHYAALYKIDSSSQDRRTRHVGKVREIITRL
ncbi:NAD(P)H-dependent oxidoreductase [Acuticoccus kandeliae]|uniref:NAD(P)H-dependent oxidoreductase n=1 Tax=Acuticoccus kandeliae TaxID=2073160 RepID=UPI000D3E19C8|nr:NAD(P)H-dependent oxidoreductase [Acuticoccus kandeliae]